MASPQTEKGFTRIANELLEVLAVCKFNGTQFRILMIVWRKTYGYNRKDHDISINYLVKATGSTKRQMQKEVNNLIELNVLTEIKAATFSTSRIIGFNKDYDTWKIGRSITIEQQANKEGGGERLDTPTGEQLDTPPGERLDTHKRKVLKKGLKTKEDEVKNADPIIELLIKNNIVSPGGINFTLQQDLEDIETNFNFDEPEAMIREAVKDAARGNGRTWKFVYNKLNLWRKQDIKNVLDLEQQANIGGKQKQGEVDFTKFAK